MDIDKRKLEEGLLKTPDCKDFFNNFIGSCEGIDVISNFVNYQKVLCVLFRTLGCSRCQAS